MSRRTLGLAVAVAGVILVAVSALADEIGVGGADTFGWKQITGVVVGAVAAVIGYVTYTKGTKPTGGTDSGE